MTTLNRNRDDFAATRVPFNLMQVIGARFTGLNTSTYYDINFNDLNIVPERTFLTETFGIKETVGIHQYTLIFSQKPSDANARKIVLGVRLVGRGEGDNLGHLRRQRAGNQNGEKEQLERGALGFE